MYFDSLSYLEGEVRKSHISEPQWHEIGMKLIPLWCNLCRLKIELAGAELMYFDNKGNMRQHPLLKEQRETIWLITRLEKAVGLTEFLHTNSSGSTPEVDLGGRSDDNWYEQLSSKEGPQIKKRKKK
jgi:hypothetical protein